MTYYAKSYPDVDEVVFVTVVRIEDNTIYCHLVEYANREGFLPKSDFSTKRCVDPRKYFNEGQVYPMIVKHINAQSESIYLNHNKIRMNVREGYNTDFAHVAKIFKFTAEIAQLLQCPINQLLPKTMWKLINKQNIHIGKEVYDTILDNPAVYIEDIIAGIPPELGQKVLTNIESRMVRTNMIVHQELNVIAICNDATNTLKTILTIPADDGGATIECMKSPKYRVVVEGNTDDECTDKIKKCINHITQNISDKIGIIFNVGTRTVVKERQVYIKHLPQQAKLS